MSVNYMELNATSENQIITGDLQEVLGKEVSEISHLQKILLTANGTVTSILEAYSSETIQVVKLAEEIVTKDLQLPNLFSTEEQVIHRKILLQGKISGRNFMYADSYVLINNLEETFRDELLNTNKPIGQIWSERKVEIFKEIIHYGKRPANELASYFCIEPEENMLFRTYSVTSQRKITMIITEKFPRSYFQLESC